MMRLEDAVKRPKDNHRSPCRSVTKVFMASGVLNPPRDS